MILTSEVGSATDLDLATRTNKKLSSFRFLSMTAKRILEQFSMDDLLVMNVWH